MEGVPFDDRGLTLGDGLFETLLARSGELVAFEAHLRRMTAGAKVLGLPPPDSDMARRLCRQALAQADLEQARAAVRLTLTAGSGGRGLDRPASLAPRLFASAAPAPKPTGPARLVVSSVRRNEGSPASRLKTLAYLDNILARREATAAHADEALMLNARGEVACAASANLFWTTGERLFTPALSCGVLDGIMRRQLIAGARSQGLVVEEVAVGLDALASADAIILSNSLIGVRAVSRLGDKVLPDHPLAATLVVWVAASI